MAVAMTSTDYVLPVTTRQSADPTHLLAIEGLWQVVEFIKRSGQQEREPQPLRSELPDDTDYDSN